MVTYIQYSYINYWQRYSTIFNSTEHLHIVQLSYDGHYYAKHFSAMHI